MNNSRVAWGRGQSGSARVIPTLATAPVDHSSRGPVLGMWRHLLLINQSKVTSKKCKHKKKQSQLQKHPNKVILFPNIFHLKTLDANSQNCKIFGCAACMFYLNDRNVRCMNISSGTFLRYYCGLTLAYYLVITPPALRHC